MSIRDQSRGPPGRRHYIDRYNRTRRHSRCEVKSPIAYEAIPAERATAAEAEAA